METTSDPAKKPKSPEEKEWKQITTGREHIDTCKLALAGNPWNPTVWMRLLQETITLNDAALVRQTFQDFFEYYHSSVHVWILLIEFEEKGRQFDQLEGIFNKCLRSVPSVELCDRYMNYVNHIHTLPEDATLEQLMESRKVVIQAFEFVLSVVGTDKCSGVIWMKFIQYVKSGDLGSTYEEQLKMDQLRKIFHRALQIPLLNIEDIWKDYDAYENSLSKLTAKKFISDRAAAYMSARGAMKDLKFLQDPMENLGPIWYASPPTWTLASWKRYIEWEKSNPLSLEDHAMLNSRVVYAYKSALLHLAHFGEIWHDLAKYVQETGNPDEAISHLKNALKFNPRKF